MNKKFLLIYKVSFALLGFSAIITEIVVLIERKQFDPGIFFNLFTFETNIMAACALLIGAYALLARGLPRWVDAIRGATTLYMLITGIVFSVLLSNLDPNLVTAVRWDNTVLHYIMPAVLVIDWFIDPPKHRFAFLKAMYWIVYPILYVVYSLIRGLFVGWYPYPFLDPTITGYAGVLAVCICIATVVTGLIWFLARAPFSSYRRVREVAKA